MDGKLEHIESSGLYRDGLVADIFSSNDNKMSLIYRKEDSADDSSTRAVIPSSCRELDLIGHSLDGLYLVQNQDTKKIETLFCDFGPTSKYITYLKCVL